MAVSIRSLSFVSAGSLLLAALGLIGGVLTARLLGAEGRGELAVILFWPHLLAGLCNMSLNEVVAVKAGVRNEDNSNSVYSSAIVISIFLSIFTIAVVWPLLPSLIAPEYEYLVGITQAYLLVFLPFSMLLGCCYGYLQAMNRFSLFNALRLHQPTMLVLLLAVAFLYQFDVSAVMIAGLTLVSFIATAAVSLFVTKIKITRPSFKSISEVFRSAIPFHAVNLILFSAVEFDKFILVTYSNPESIGYYVVALSVAGAGSGIISNTANSMLPSILANKADVNEGKSYFIIAILVIASILILSTLPLMILANYFIPILYGVTFDSAVSIALILIPALGIRCLRQIIDRLLRSLGYVYRNAIPEIVALVSLLVFAPILFNAYGLNGLAFAQLIAQFIALICVLYIAFKSLEIKGFDLENAARRTMLIAKDSLLRVVQK